MLIQIILAMMVLSLLLYGLEMMPMPPLPKRIAMAATVLCAALTLANHAGLLR